jgi:hypothetical protein
VWHGLAGGQEQASFGLTQFNGVLQLQPLSNQQIQAYLVQVGKSDLWQQIQAVPEMRQLLEPVNVPDDLRPHWPKANGTPGLLRLPLFLAMAAQVYAPDRVVKNKHELLEAYIDGQLQPETRKADRHHSQNWAFATVGQEPDWRVVKRTLVWAAQQLKAQYKADFLIEQIHLTGLGSNIIQRQYRLIFSLIYGLLYGMSMATLMFGLYPNFFGGIGWLLGYGLINGLIGVMLSWAMTTLTRINGSRFPVLMSSAGWRAILWSLRAGLITGLTCGLSFGLVLGLFPILFFGLPQALGHGAIHGLRYGLVWAFIALGVGISYGLAYGFVSGIMHRLGGLKPSFKVPSRPNQGVWNLLHKSLLASLLGYLSGIWIAAMYAIEWGKIAAKISMDEPLNWTSVSEIFPLSAERLILIATCLALIAGLFLVGTFLIQHVILRIFLAFHHKIPWNLARFLTYCHERRLLQQIGGRYRFIHRELLDHFASME